MYCSHSEMELRLAKAGRDWLVLVLMRRFKGQRGLGLAGSWKRDPNMTARNIRLYIGSWREMMTLKLILNIVMLVVEDCRSGHGSTRLLSVPPGKA